MITNNYNDNRGFHFFLIVKHAITTQHTITISKKLMTLR